MKDVLPDRLLVEGVYWTIVWEALLPDNEMGVVSSKDHTILIAPHQSVEGAVQTLLEEILHIVIPWKLLDDEKEDTVVHTTGSRLMGVLRDNPVIGQLVIGMDVLEGTDE